MIKLLHCVIAFLGLYIAFLFEPLTLLSNIGIVIMGISLLLLTDYVRKENDEYDD